MSHRRRHNAWRVVVWLVALAPGAGELDAEARAAPAVSPADSSADDLSKPNRRPTHLVAEVNGARVLWRDVAPPAEWYEKRAEYKRKHGHTLGYESPDDYPLSRLKELVWNPLLARYRKEHAVEPTEQEVEQFIVRARQARERRSREAALEIEQLQEQVEQDRHELNSTQLSEQNRRNLERTISIRERELKALRTQQEFFAKDQTAEEERFFAKWSLGNWKLQQSLYKKYGGRAIWQQVGPEALDAMRDFLREKERDGFFTIHDPELNERFWEYYVNDRVHVFVQDADRVFQHPWSPFEEPGASD